MAMVGLSGLVSTGSSIMFRGFLFSGELPGNKAQPEVLQLHSSAPFFVEGGVWGWGGVCGDYLQDPNQSEPGFFCLFIYISFSSSD